jgi:hypothetical protein
MCITKENQLMFFTEQSEICSEFRHFSAAASNHSAAEVRIARMYPVSQACRKHNTLWTLSIARNWY